MTMKATMRKDRDTVFQMFGVALYRGVLGGTACYIQRCPGDPRIAHWNLVMGGELVDIEYETKFEAETDAVLFVMTKAMEDAA